MFSKKREDGAVVIEATIALSAFMFAIVMILSILNICIVQARVGNAINITAREISQYSYLYGVSGMNKFQNDLHESSSNTKKNIDDIMKNVNEVYGEVAKITENENPVSGDITGSVNRVTDILESYNKDDSAGKKLVSQLEEIAENPKELMFGMARIAADKVINKDLSELLAKAMAKPLCRKNLTHQKGSDPGIYLKHLGVVPDSKGSYIDGLDFSGSSLFCNGSNLIIINVNYDVKVVPLLPLDFKFHFNQKAITHGWLAGEKSYVSTNDLEKKYEDGADSLWTKASVEERSSFIRHMGMRDYEDQGYYKVSGYDGTYSYSKDKNQFVRFTSMNPLYSSNGKAVTVENMDKDAVKKTIENLCGKMDSTTRDSKTVITKHDNKGTEVKEKSNCANAKNKLIITIPEDKGLREAIETIVAEANTRNVEIELVSRFGNGANKVEK